MDSGLGMLDIVAVVWNRGSQLLVDSDDPGFARVGLVAAAFPVGFVIPGAAQEVAEAVEDRVLLAFCLSRNEV